MRHIRPGFRSLLSGIALVGMVSCAGIQVRDESEIVRRQLDKARSSGAKRCAPRELAIAEANHAFADAELKKGNASRAHEHMTLASTAVQKALVDSKDCGPRNVIIRKEEPPPPPPVVSVKVVDTDGDGIPDNEDECPLDPGPAANRGCPILDTDGDGLLDDEDDCPLDPGPRENRGCPILDTDGDGLPDDQDECPTEPGPASNRGCPIRDTDGDGIFDDVDECPNEPGIPELNGCPPTDRDGDGIPDHLDKCPDEPGIVEEQGCPRKYTLVVVKNERIEILEQVLFETGKHRILPESFGLLDQVALVLKDAPKIRVRIEGHTDSQGAERSNMTLSQNRADSVRDYLINVGIAADRLLAVGFGETTPIASNSTVQGRALNRRVEFNITER